MNYSISRFLVYLLIILSSLVSVSLAQSETLNDLGTEVSILGGIGKKRINCYPTNKLIVTKQEFKKLLKDKKCSLLKAIKVDFKKHTLVNYRVGGDCFMRVTQKIFRNDKTKTYTIEVKNYWGRCRAGGSHYSWIVIDKIPKDYSVALKEIQIDNIREKDSTRFGLMTLGNIPRPPAILYNEQVDMNGCLPMYRQKHLVIKDKQTYFKNIRNDSQTSTCKENAGNLNFQNHSYLGIQINSGYCRYPKGLQHRLLKDNGNKKYILKISYIDPGNQTCRALSRYDFWIKTPKLEKDFKVTFEITPKKRNSKIKVSYLYTKLV